MPVEAPMPPVASTSDTPYVPNPVKHGATVVLAEAVENRAPGYTDTHSHPMTEKLSTPAANAASSSDSRVQPAATTAPLIPQPDITASSRKQRIEQAVQDALRSPPSERPSPAPITPTRPQPRAVPAPTAEPATSRLAAYTATRPPHTGATTLTSDGVFATAAARAAFTSPTRPANRNREQDRNAEAGPSTVVATLPVRGRGRIILEEPTYRDIGVEAKLCDCCRDGAHRNAQSRKRSASPPPRRSQPPTTRPRGREEKPATQESTKSLERTQAISITESDLNVRVVSFSVVCFILISLLSLCLPPGVCRRVVA